MVFTYQVADGHDNEAGYSNITHQPRCEGVKYARTVDAPSGDVYEDGAYADLIHSTGEEQGLTAAQFDTLLTEYGLTTVNTNQITITLPDLDRTAVNYNATIVRPRPKWRKGQYHDVVFRVKLLAVT